MNRGFISFLILLLFSCGSKHGSQPKYFYLPWLGTFQQATVANSDSIGSVHFTGYGGFYFISKDSIFKRIILEISSQDEVESTELVKKRVEELRSELVERIKITISVKGGDDRLRMKKILRERFKLFLISEQKDGFLVKDRCEKVLAEIVFNDIGLYNFQVVIYPTEKECLEVENL